MISKLFLLSLRAKRSNPGEKYEIAASRTPRNDGKRESEIAASQAPRNDRKLLFIVKKIVV
ncbi:MAG: hypothetical protein U9P63_01080 [Patescibacteria group bacterium]|nr:hypothetical protein [Patescibacteria group bacterium]